MKKKHKKSYSDKQAFVVALDIFDVDIGVCINMSEKEIKQWVKKVSGKKYKHFDEEKVNDWDKDETDVGRTIYFLSGVILLFRFEKDQFRKSCGIIVHEVAHTVFHLCNTRRTPLVEDTDEIYAYMTESLMKKILYKLY